MLYKVTDENKWYPLDPEKVESTEAEVPPTEEDNSHSDSSSEDSDESGISLESETSGGSH